MVIEDVELGQWTNHSNDSSVSLKSLVTNNFNSKYFILDCLLCCVLMYFRVCGCKFATNLTMPLFAAKRAFQILHQCVCLFTANTHTMVYAHVFALNTYTQTHCVCTCMVCTMYMVYMYTYKVYVCLWIVFHSPAGSSHPGACSDQQRETFSFKSSARIVFTNSADHQRPYLIKH